MAVIERPEGRAPGVRTVLADWGPLYAANGFVGFLFAATGPVAIILAAAAQGRLTQAELASWIFGVFAVNGLVTVGMSWRYRQPLCVFWTIPGTVLVGQALQHMGFAEAIAAFYVTGLVVLAVGLSGLAERAMALVPMPVVMGMVAGVFLRFGTELVRALAHDGAVAGPMVAAFFLLAATPAGRRLPPVIGALLAGVAATWLLGRVDPGALGAFRLARPVVLAPVWSWRAMAELVLPLALTVLVVQNGQGFAILTQAGHRPPVNATTVVCGLTSLVCAAVGGVSTCLAGPTNALASASGERTRHYIAAMTTGVLAIAFGLLAPSVTGLVLAAPPALMLTLGGLAMLRVLQGAFISSFAGRFTMGALVSFVVTVADVPVLHVGGAFWGLVAGVAAAALLEREDMAGHWRR